MGTDGQTPIVLKNGDRIDHRIHTLKNAHGSARSSPSWLAERPGSEIQQLRLAVSVYSSSVTPVFLTPAFLTPWDGLRLRAHWWEGIPTLADWLKFFVTRMPKRESTSSERA